MQMQLACQTRTTKQRCQVANRTEVSSLQGTNSSLEYSRERVAFICCIINAQSERKHQNVFLHPLKRQRTVGNSIIFTFMLFLSRSCRLTEQQFFICNCVVFVHQIHAKESGSSLRFYLTNHEQSRGVKQIRSSRRRTVRPSKIRGAYAAVLKFSSLLQLVTQWAFGLFCCRAVPGKF